MKKNRPATLITLLADPKDSNRLGISLLRETGSFGLRIRRAERICLAREIRKVKTRFGTIELKMGMHEDKIISVKPEFDSCSRLAKKIKKPVRVIWTAALAECSKIFTESCSFCRKSN